MVSPLGGNAETTWQNIIAGKNGAEKITSFEVEDLAAKIACQIPLGDTADGAFNPDDWMEVKEQRKVDPFIVYAVSAATQALYDAGWHPKTDEDQHATGTLIGSGIGGLQGIEETSILLRDRGPRRVSPFFIPGRLINLASGQVSIMHGLKGPNHSVVTACSTGAHAIGDAGRMIALGDADVDLAAARALVRAAHWLYADNNANREEAVRILSQPKYVGADEEVIANSMTGTFEYERGDVRSVPDFNVFFRYNATYPYYSDAIWYLTQMRRWGQIDEQKADDWYFDMAAQVYRPDLYQAAAESLIEEGTFSADQFPAFASETGFKPEQTEFIDGIPYNGREPNAYLSRFPIGLQGSNE